MLKGNVFEEQLFENQIFALFFDTMLDQNCGVASNYKDGMPITYSGGNITIGSGAVCIRGRLLEENIGTTLAVGQTSKYHKLVIEIDLDKPASADNFQQAYYKILTSASAYPTLTQTDIVKNVSGIYQYELAQFRTNSSGNITDFVDKRTFLDINSIYTAIQASVNALLNTLNGNAQTLISDLQSEIAGVEDGSEFVMKSTIKSLEGDVTPTLVDGHYEVSIRFNLPSGYNAGNVIPLKLEALIDTGIVGYYYQILGNYTTTPVSADSRYIDIDNLPVSQDTSKLKLTFMRS
jgi:hypothetical protein